MKNYILSTLILSLGIFASAQGQAPQKSFMTLRAPSKAEVALTNQRAALDKKIVAAMKAVNNAAQLKAINDQMMALHKELAQARKSTFDKLGIPPLQEKIVSGKAAAAQIKEFKTKQTQAQKQLKSVRTKTLKKLTALTKKRDKAMQTIIDTEYPQIKALLKRRDNLTKKRQALRA